MFSKALKVGFAVGSLFALSQSFACDQCESEQKASASNTTNTDQPRDFERRYDNPQWFWDKSHATWYYASSYQQWDGRNQTWIQGPADGQKYGYYDQTMNAYYNYGTQTWQGFPNYAPGYYGW